MPELLLLFVCCALLAAAVVFDLVSRQIPNTVPVALFGLFALHVAVTGHRDIMPLWAHVLTGAVLLAVGFVLYLMGALGAGDGKLLAAAGLWVGPAGMGSFLVGVGLLGLGLASSPCCRFRRLAGCVTIFHSRRRSRRRPSCSWRYGLSP